MQSYAFFSPFESNERIDYKKFFAWHLNCGMWPKWIDVKYWNEERETKKSVYLFTLYDELSVLFAHVFISSTYFFLYFHSFVFMEKYLKIFPFFFSFSNVTDNRVNLLDFHRNEDDTVIMQEWKKFLLTECRSWRILCLSILSPHPFPIKFSTKNVLNSYR